MPEYVPQPNRTHETRLLKKIAGFGAVILGACVAMRYGEVFFQGPQEPGLNDAAYAAGGLILGGVILLLPPSERK